MKKTFLIFLSFLILLTALAGCGKKASGDPAASTTAAEETQLTLEAVSGDDAEVTILFDEMTTQGAAKTEAGSTKAGETRSAAKAEQTTAKAAKPTAGQETTAKAGQTTAKADQTTAKADQTTAKADQTTAKTVQTTAKAVPPQATTTASALPDLGSGEKATTNSGATLPTADSGKDRYELPAIPLN